MKLWEYQKLMSLDTGSTEYYREFLDVLGYDDSVSVEKYLELVKDSVEGMRMRFRRFFRVGWRWYYVPKNLRRVRLGDWSRFEGVMGVVEGESVLGVLDEVIACLSYPVLGRKKGKDVDKLMKGVREMDVEVALGVGFFLSKLVGSYIKSMKGCYMTRMMEMTR